MMKTQKKTKRSTTSRKDFGHVSFTYFVPNPPKKKVGHREHEFDEIFTNILNSDFELLEMKTQSAHGADGAGGLWIICLLQAKSKKAFDSRKDLQFIMGLDTTPPLVEIEYE